MTNAINITAAGASSGGLFENAPAPLVINGISHYSFAFAPVALTPARAAAKHSPLAIARDSDEKGLANALEIISLTLNYEAEEGTAVYDAIRRGNRREVETLLDGERRAREEGARQRGENISTPTIPSNPTTSPRAARRGNHSKFPDDGAPLLNSNY